MDKNKKLNPVVRYFFNVALSWDQLLNAHAGGDEDETISSRLGKIQRDNGGVVPWYRPLAKFLVWGLDKIDEGHCLEAIEDDEGEHAIFQ